jgi:YVTN family beta-propeller protein
MKMEEKKPSVRGVLLFVSNSASNYISIIDRNLERVVGAITVGARPMGMAVNSAGDILYVVNAGSRDISEVDAAHHHVRGSIDLPAGVEPTDVAFVPDYEGALDGKLYVVNRMSNDVSVVSTEGRRFLKSIVVGAEPSFVAADAVRKEVYVVNSRTNDVSVVSAATDTVVATIRVDTKPTGLIVGEEKLYILNEGSRTVTVASKSARNIVDNISVSEAPTRGLRGFGGRLFVANAGSGTVTFLNRQNIATRVVRTGKGPMGIAKDETRNRLYVANSGESAVTILDPIGERVVKELSVGKAPYATVSVER